MKSRNGSSLRSHLLMTFAAILLLVALPQTVTAIPNAVFEGVQQDDAELIKQALDDNPSLLNSIGVGGQTPLIHAVLTGKLTAVQTLLENGADTQMVEKDGYNLLHAAGFQGRADILQYLLEKKVDLDPLEAHADGYYPLHRACWGPQQRHTDTVKVFLEHGIAFDLKDVNNAKTCADMTRNEATKALLAEYENKKDGQETTYEL